MTDFVLTDFTARNYQKALEGVADNLRRLADQVQQDGKPHATESFDGTPRFANAANNALHTLAWGIANLNAPRLVQEAAQADMAERSDGAA